MKKLLIVFCVISALLYSCSENEPEPQTIYVDKIVEVPVPISGGEYPDSLKWFLGNHPDFINFIVNEFKEQRGLLIISYGDNSLYNKNDFTTTKKLPWHTISAVIYSSATNGALTPDGAKAHYIIHLNGEEMSNRGDDSINAYALSSYSGYNPNFYGDGQIVLATSVNP